MQCLPADYRLFMSNMELWTNIIGYSATVCMVCGYLPQAWQTIRTRNTDGLAMPTFLALGLGSVFFVVQGLLTGNWPLVIANAITTVCSVIITVIKVRNDMRRRRR